MTMKLIIGMEEAKKHFSEGLVSLYCDCNKPITNLLDIDIYVTSENIESSILFETKEVKLKKRTETERVAYLVGKYFTGEITLKFLKIQIDAIEEPMLVEVNT